MKKGRQVISVRWRSLRTVVSAVRVAGVRRAGREASVAGVSAVHPVRDAAADLRQCVPKVVSLLPRPPSDFGDVRRCARCETASRGGAQIMAVGVARTCTRIQKR